MNPLALKITELCPSLFLIRPGTFEAKFVYWNDDGKTGSAVDPTTDLNACAEFEKGLVEYTLIYVEELKRLTYNDTPHAISYDEYITKELEWCGDVFATATQRCLAFVKTMKEK